MKDTFIKLEDVDGSIISRSIESLIGKKIAIHCDTEEKANEFLKKLDAVDVRWGDGSRAIDNSEYNDFQQRTCYSMESGKAYLSVYYEQYYLDEEYEIYKYKLDNEVAKFKVGDCVMFVKDTSVGQSTRRRQLIGKNGLITEIEAHDEYGYIIPSISEDYYFTNGELELVKCKDNSDTGEADNKEEENKMDGTKSIREIYENNIGSWIGATMQDGELFFGELVDIQHNDFIVRDEMGLVSMFRYEELARLVCKSDMEDFFECKKHV